MARKGQKTMNATEINESIRSLIDRAAPRVGPEGRGINASDRMALAMRFFDENGIYVPALQESAFDVQWDIVPVPAGFEVLVVAVSGSALEKNLNEEDDKHWNVLELFAVRDFLRNAISIYPPIARHVITTGPVEVVHRPEDRLARIHRLMAVMVTRFPLLVATDTIAQSEKVGTTKPDFLPQKKDPYGF